MGQINFKILLIGIFILLGCSSPKTPKNTVPNGEKSGMDWPELLMVNPYVQSFGDNGLQWEMSSDEARGYTRENFLDAVGLTIQLYEDGKPSSTIEAGEGIINTQKLGDAASASAKSYRGSPPMRPGDMYMEKNVVVVSTDGTRLTTDWVHYHRNQELIKSTAPVEFVRADSVTHGQGMEATPDLSRVQIFNQTVVIKNQDEDEAVTP